jgi:phenylacetate-CoA ligase
MNLERLYLKLPAFAQNWACSFEGWRIKRQRYSAAFWQKLRSAEERMHWPYDRMCAFRDARLRDFLVHCAATVPYYRRVFAECGFDPQRLQRIDDLQQLPILKKDTVRERSEEFVSEAVPPRERIMAHTSGTTGSGLRFAVTQDAIQEQWATWWRYRRWHGITHHTWCGYFGGRSVVPLEQDKPPYWRVNRPGRQVMFSGYHLSQQNAPSYVAELRRRRLPWLHGYPSMLALLASYVIESGDALGYSVRNVTTGAENLLPQQAAAIEQAFGVKPLQNYGMAEGVANFSEFRDERLYVDEDFSAVEFIKNAAGGFKVVGTNFTNTATPLVRYEVGDLVELPPARGGSKAPVPGREVTAIDGRQEEYVVLRNGARIGRMDHVFKDMTQVREAQIVQRAPGDLLVRIVRGAKYGGDDEARLRQEFYQRVGAEADVKIEYVEAIEKTATGKLRFVVTE